MPTLTTAVQHCWWSSQSSQMRKIFKLGKKKKKSQTNRQHVLYTKKKSHRFTKYWRLYINPMVINCSYPLQCICSQIFCSREVMELHCWNQDSKRGTLISGWLSKYLLFGRITVENSYSTILLTSLSYIALLKRFQHIPQQCSTCKVHFCTQFHRYISITSNTCTL